MWNIGQLVPLFIVIVPSEGFPSKVTFVEQIAPIVFQNCSYCHRPGEVAPFSLLNYNDTRKHAKGILRAVQDRFMPPWMPEAGHGEFRNERRLTPEQIELFNQWIKSGMPEGDARLTPAIPQFPKGWKLGKPDLILKLDRPFEVPAEGPDIYQNFVLETGLTENKWVKAIEFRASAPEVVHHVLYFLDDTGRARVKASQGDQPGFRGIGFRPTGSLGGWAVGLVPFFMPDGLAYPLSKKSDLVLQTHFHPSGKPVKELLTVGLYFADKPSSRTIIDLAVPPSFGFWSGIDIPSGKPDFQIKDSFKLPVDVDLVTAGTHAHILGKKMRAYAILPDGIEKKLFSIRDWDFNWQGIYLYKEFVRLPKGTIIYTEMTWDNSINNPRNPQNPPKGVRWGESTLDEMGQVGFKVVAAKESDKRALNEAIENHLIETATKARLRGDKFDWEKLGMEPPQYWIDILRKYPEKTPGQK